jgi:predicted enzyme related to lactoylglutathione lyase
MDDIKFAAHDETASARRPSYYGVHHLALNTDDMKMTVDFYVGVLGMRLVHAMKVPPRCRHGSGQPW